jgi:hypothetical protein
MMDAAYLPVSGCGINASVRVSSNLFSARALYIKSAKLFGALLRIDHPLPRLATNCKALHNLLAQLETG